MKTSAEVRYYEAYRRDTFCFICNLIITLLILVGVIACAYMAGVYSACKSEADRAKAEADAYFAAHPGMEVR